MATDIAHITAELDVQAEELAKRIATAQMERAKANDVIRAARAELAVVDRMRTAAAGPRRRTRKADPGA